MFEFFPGWLVLTVVLGLGCVFLAVALRRRQPARRATPRDSSLPPVSAEDAQRIFEHARGAAIERVMTQSDPRNPHPPGTRAHILWETEFGRALMDLTH